MLQHLSIRDFVIVDTLELDFSGGFSVLTGETGAGKSILIDALALALGDRGDANVVRTGCERTDITAEFDIKGIGGLRAWLKESDLDGDEDICLLRRVVDGSGRSRAYINGHAATLTQLREAGEWLVDIHGQHAHQSLLRADAQRNLLDSHAALADAVKAVGERYRTWQRLKQTRLDREQNAQALEAEREQLDWQTRELKQLHFEAAEWEALEQEHKRLSHVASLTDGVQFVLDALLESEQACVPQLGTMTSRLDSLTEYDDNLSAANAELESARIALTEAAHTLRAYRDKLELDPARLSEVEERLDAINSMARKYRVRAEELPDLLARLSARLEEIAPAADLDALLKQEQAAQAEYKKLAGELSKQRAAAAQKLAKAVTASMQELAMAGGRFEVQLTPLAEGAVYGLEQTEFLVSANAGTPARPLAKVASGGELSRISLAIQVITSKAAAVPTLIFDEVDVGIGGGVAEIVGRELRALGKSRQVLCVTHLPQVAAQGDEHWSVAKVGDDKSVKSQVTSLDKKARVEEIARMLGGVEITATTRKHAQELLASR